MSEICRILHVVNNLGRGGMESRIMDLYRHIDRTQFQYDFYIESGKRGVFDDEVIELGGKIFYGKNFQKYNLPNFAEFNNFLALHSEYKIVYAYNQWAGFYLKSCKDHGVPIRIANSRAAPNRITLKNIVRSIVKINVNKYATHKFAVSKKAANWLFGQKELKKGNVKIWPNAIDTSRFSFSASVRKQMRDKLGIADDELVVMRVANLVWGKNYPFTLKVFSELYKLNDRARLVIIGAGDIEPLKKLARELGIEERVQYLGQRADIPELLMAGDICLHPSFYEGFPGAVLEAEASGQWCFLSDSITDEVLLTDHIMRLPLTYGEAKWAQIIHESYTEFDRSKAHEQIAAAGYDIFQVAEDTMSFYRSLMNA